MLAIILIVAMGSVFYGLKLIVQNLRVTWDWHYKCTDDKRHAYKSV